MTMTLLTLILSLVETRHSLVVGVSVMVPPAVIEIIAPCNHGLIVVSAGATVTEPRKKILSTTKERVYTL